MWAILLLWTAPAAAAETEQDEAATNVAPNPAAWVTAGDYPPRAMMEGRKGVTGFRLTVGADGLPTRCEITSSSGHDDLDAATCRTVMRRARIRPWRNERGEATPVIFSSRVNWTIFHDQDDEVAAASDMPSPGID